MTHTLTTRLRRAACALTALTAVAALAGGALAPASASASALVVGIGDQNPSFFGDPHFGALGLTEARLVVPWNTSVTRSGQWRAQTRKWLTAAAAAHVTPLVSFSGTAWQAPTVSQYARAVRAFVHEFPSVQRFTPWNEPDWVYRSLGRKPALAAAYYDALRATCHSCLVLAGDVYLPASQLAPWLKAYTRALHHRPQGWALHDYYDVRDHSAAQLRVMMRLTRGQIWLDETGGVERRGHWRPASPAGAAADERYLFSLPRRYPRISRIYHYQWRVTSRTGWDSALIGLNGALRPAYKILSELVHRPPYAL